MAGVTLEAGGKRHKSMRNWTLMIKWGLGVSSGCPKNPEEIKFTLAGMERCFGDPSSHWCCAW